MSEVQLTTEDGIAVVTINRPEARNAVNAAVAKGIAEAMDSLDQREDLRIGIITGAGGTFCSGMDLKAFLRREAVRLEGRGFAGLVEAPPKKPLIAAIEGYALAGGFEIALACDLIVAAQDARFGLPEVKRGLAPTAGGLLRLPKQLPMRIARELVLTGEMVQAEKLAAYGLINRIVAPGTALTVALDLARAIAENGPLAVAACKRVMQEAQDWSSAEMFRKQSEIAAHVFASDDAREGASAFAEKRKPVWRGR
jgi:enoyl-CoA hydratase